MTLVFEALGKALPQLEVPLMFGLPGSGNYELVHAARAAGVSYCGANHEAGAVGMADGWARVSRRTGVAMLSQGPGLTNALTALTEAVKSRTPLVVIVIDTPRTSLHGNLNIDQRAVVTVLGAGVDIVRSPQTAVSDLVRAFRRTSVERRPVVLMLPLDLIRAEVPDSADRVVELMTPSPPWPGSDVIGRVSSLIAAAHRPVIVAGRGAIAADAKEVLVALGDRIGAMLTASAPAKGFFAGEAFDLGISGSFASPLAAELLVESDLVLAFGASLNAWTTGNGKMICDAVAVVQVDSDSSALGVHRGVIEAIHADARTTAIALLSELNRRSRGSEGYRNPSISKRISEYDRSEEFTPDPRAERVDPRVVTLALDEMLPVERTVTIDSGHFMGWPAKYLGVPDAAGFVYPQSFQCVGLGLAASIGASLARPDRISVIAIGDGGMMLSTQELDTAVRHRLPLLVAIYNDCAYGAEVHRFAPMGLDVDLVQFPERDFASVARASGAEAITVRTMAELDGLRKWIADPQGPMVIDIRIDPTVRGDWVAGNSKAALT